MNKELIKILDELFEMFAFYRDHSIQYDGDPFGDSTFSLKQKDEAWERMHRVDHEIHRKGWDRFEELRQQYFKKRKREIEII